MKPRGQRLPERSFMKRESTTSAIALVIALVTLFVVYISSGTTQTTVPQAAPHREKEVPS
jgi:hypothetical protein